VKLIAYLCMSSFMLLHFFIHPVIPYVHPQPGENLWGLVAREGVAIDYLLDHTCTGSTAGCDFTITQADIGNGGVYIISAPGKYCLSASVTYTTSNAITINTQGVILDLGQFEIRRTAINPDPTTGGAIVDFGGQNIIQNGTIYNDTVLLNSNNSIMRNCVMESIPVVPCSIITGTGSSNSTIDSCQIRKSLGAGFQLLGPKTVARNCSVTGCNSDGFYITGDDCEISNCVSAYNGNIGINNFGTGLVVCNNSVHNNTFNYNNVSESSLCSLIANAGCDFTITQADIGNGGTYVISAPGKYCLSASVTYTTSNAITINTQGVILDLGQFEIRRTAINPDPTTGGAIVDFGGQNIIQNGTIYNDTVLLNSFNTLIRNCVTESILNVPCSIVTGTGSSDCTIDSCQVRKSLGACFQLLGPKTIARNCSATVGNSDGFVVMGNDCEISNCVSAYNNGAGIRNLALGLVVCNNSVHNNFFNYINTSESSLCSLISECCACQFFITQANVPNYIISQPGVYCVAGPLTLGSTGGNPVINVQSGDVVLDFRGNSISASNTAAVVSVSGQYNVVIRNATIDIQGQQGILLSNASSGIVIENCYIRNSLGNAIVCTDSSDVVIKNCLAENCFGSTVLINSNSNGITIQNCGSVLNCQGTGIGGFVVNSASSNVVFDSCYSYSTVNGNASGFYLDSSASQVVLKNCESNSNASNGFSINSSNSSVNDCVAYANGQSGFVINQGASATIRISVVGCQALSNGRIGFDNLGTPSYIFNNIAANNATADYAGVTAGTLVASTAVTSATGFWANIST